MTDAQDVLLVVDVLVMQDIDTLLEKYAQQLTADSEKSLAAVQLYRKAGRFIDAAKIVFGVRVHASSVPSCDSQHKLVSIFSWPTKKRAPEQLRCA